MLFYMPAEGKVSVLTCQSRSGVRSRTPKQASHSSLQPCTLCLDSSARSWSMCVWQSDWMQAWEQYVQWEKFGQKAPHRPPVLSQWIFCLGASTLLRRAAVPQTMSRSLPLLTAPFCHLHYLAFCNSPDHSSWGGLGHQDFRKPCLMPCLTP